MLEVLIVNIIIIHTVHLLVIISFIALLCVEAIKLIALASGIGTLQITQNSNITSLIITTTIIII
jgi:hypothetical protein